MHPYRKFIHSEMDARGWKPADLARRSGLSRQTLSKILNDDRARLGQMPDDSTIDNWRPRSVSPRNGLGKSPSSR